MKGQLEAKGLYGRVMSIKECLLLPASLGISMRSSREFLKKAAIKQEPVVKN